MGRPMQAYWAHTILAVLAECEIIRTCSIDNLRALDIRRRLESALQPSEKNK